MFVWLVAYPYGSTRIRCKDSWARVKFKFPVRCALQTKLKEIGKEEMLINAEVRVPFKACARGIAKITDAKRSNAFTIWDEEETILASYNAIHKDMASFQVDQFWK